jgi:hypothetical protein
MIHTSQQFRVIVAALNGALGRFMSFELTGSLTQRHFSQHDADIIVHPRVRFSRSAFLAGCRNQGAEVLAVDATSAVRFPGRPQGQDRIQMRWPSGMVIDFFFPKGFLAA